MSFELPRELEERTIREMERAPDRKGTFCNLWLFDIFAAKSPHGNNQFLQLSYDEWQRKFQNAAAIAQDLIPKGVRMPRIYGVSIHPSGKPFLVMDKLPALRSFDILPPQDAEDFVESYRTQRRIILDSGYVMADNDFQAENSNCGFNREDRQAWFYDIDFWKRK